MSKAGFVYPGVRTISDLKELQPDAESREIFICGGAQIYEQTLGLCSDLYLTLVKKVVEGDAFFPAFETEFDLVEEVQDGPEFKILHYRNRQ